MHYSESAANLGVPHIDLTLVLYYIKKTATFVTQWHKFTYFYIGIII